MKPWIKPVVYVVLGLLALWMVAGFYQNYTLSNKAAAQRTVDGDAEPARLTNDARAQSRMMGYGFGLVLVAAGLGFMISRDASYWFASHGVDTLLSDNVDPVKDPDYDHAEQVALEGRPLEAIDLLRQFLKLHPRELYAAIRIAEIYENDLQNPLAAALEYEEVLKHKFNPEKWGWAAIHLVNIYNGKLNRPEQAMGWLRRIVAEHPATAAARKARERLGLPEGATLCLTAEPASNQEPPPPGPPSNLPPGFSPKKR
jgi:hypothetical protein